MSVADLLRQSRAAHERKHRAAGLVDQRGTVIAPPNYAEAEAHIAEALRLRLEAHDLDPDHTDPAWAEDARLMRVPHDDLVAWYRHYPTIP